MGLYRFKITTKVLVDRNDYIDIEANSIYKALDIDYGKEVYNRVQ